MFGPCSPEIEQALESQVLETSTIVQERIKCVDNIIVPIDAIIPRIWVDFTRMN